MGEDLRAGEVACDGAVQAHETSFCWAHYVHEDVPPNAYRICFECSHVYPTKRSLRRAYRDAAPRLTWRDWLPPGDPMWGTGPIASLRFLWRRLTIRADRIFFCQECIHDF